MFNPFEASLNYFDYNATTPCDPKVLDAMMPYLTFDFGNPHSRSHAFGMRAKDAIEYARTQIASAIHALPNEIIFTSGATESVNLAIKGVVSIKRNTVTTPHIITSMIEHKCVLDTAFSTAQVSLVKPDVTGIIHISDIEKLITPNTVLISIGYVNNEIGVIQNIHEIGQMCKKHNILFHTDAAQALGKIDVHTDYIDLMSFSSHKCYGPKGIGCLYIRSKPKVRLHALITGGGQERNIRSGTLPTALCVGFGKAAELSSQNLDTERLWKIHTQFLSRITDSLDKVYFNGHRTQRVPNNINLSFAYVEGESLIMGLQNIAVSSGSACTSASLEPSYVLKAIGVTELLAHSSLRISFGRFTTLENAMEVADKIIYAVKKLRDMSPLTEMAAQGIDLDNYKWKVH